MQKLTTKQKMVLEAIEWFINEKGYSPTIKELSEMLNTTTRPVFEKILILEEQGYIKTDYNKENSSQNGRLYSRNKRTKHISKMFGPFIYLTFFSWS